jgi:hypothetical protein
MSRTMRSGGTAEALAAKNDLNEADAGERAPVDEIP